MSALTLTLTSRSIRIHFCILLHVRVQLKRAAASVERPGKRERVVLCGVVEELDLELRRGHSPTDRKKSLPKNQLVLLVQDSGDFTPLHG